MAVFTIMVSKNPADARNAENAIAFCHAALNSGHKIEQVFFYRSGVQNASTYLSSLAGEFSHRQAWLDLANNHSVKLNVCHTAAEKRAMRGKVLDAKQNESSGNIEAPFELAGLSDYFIALNNDTINVQL